MPLTIQNILGSGIRGAGAGYEMTGGSTGEMGGTGAGGEMGGNTTTTPKPPTEPKMKPEEYLLIGAGAFVVIVLIYILIKK